MSTSRVDVGTPIKNLRGWTITEVNFLGFANLPTTRGNENYVTSPEFSCFGHQWVMSLYPGGRTNSNEGFIAVELAKRSNTSIKVQWGYNVRDVDGKEVVCKKSFTDKFDAKGSNGTTVWYTSSFAKRSTLMELLVQGSLIIEVRMKPTSIDKSITQFIPTNPINKNILELFMNEETADVVFELGQNQQFHAHRPILQNSASTLYEMCGKLDESGGITTVSITDVKTKIFGDMLYYVYGGKLSENELNKNNAKEIINACDKYGVVNLKLEAEACYVESTEFTMDNIMDNLLYADAKNLALLKEAVMDYIVANKHSIISKVSLVNFPGHLATDLLTAVARGEEAGEEKDESAKYNTMRVGALRKKLNDKGLDVDGSREAMIARLKEHDW